LHSCAFKFKFLHILIEHHILDKTHKILPTSIGAYHQVYSKRGHFSMPKTSKKGKIPHMLVYTSSQVTTIPLPPFHIDDPTLLRDPDPYISTEITLPQEYILQIEELYSYHNIDMPLQLMVHSFFNAHVNGAPLSDTVVPINHFRKTYATTQRSKMVNITYDAGNYLMPTNLPKHNSNYNWPPPAAEPPGPIFIEHWASPRKPWIRILVPPAINRIYEPLFPHLYTANVNVPKIALAIEYSIAQIEAPTNE